MRTDYAETYIEPRFSYKGDFVYFKGTANLHVSREERSSKGSHARRKPLSFFKILTIYLYISDCASGQRSAGEGLVRYFRSVRPRDVASGQETPTRDKNQKTHVEPEMERDLLFRR